MKEVVIYILTFLFQNIIGGGPPTLPPDTPRLTIIDVYENNPVELLCPDINATDLSFQWSKNNEDLDPIWPSQNIDIKRSILKIHHVQLSDAGLYKCNLVNGFGSVHAQFQINVKSNGTIFHNLHNKNERNEMSRDMNSLNGEPPEFIPRRDDGQSGLTKVMQPVGTTARLTCVASGKPAPEIRWKKNGKILSADEYGITQSPVLAVKDLRQSDSGNYTCELFNSFGSINATFMLIVTEKLQFFGSDPQNKSVQKGERAVINCSVQTADRTIRIQWLKKINSAQLFRPDATVIESEPYEIIEESVKQELRNYSKSIVSKALIFSSVTSKEAGQYLCLIENDKLKNYRKAFIQVIDNSETTTVGSNYASKHLIAIIIPLCILGLLLLFIFCLRSRRRKSAYPQGFHSRSGDSIKVSSVKHRQPLIHHVDSTVPSVTSRKTNDYIANSIDSIPITRQYQLQQRYKMPLSTELVSLASSNLYYARVQAL